MRLKQHLNETTKVTEKEVKEILDKSFNAFLKSTKSKHWPIIFEKLHAAFEKYNIILVSNNTFTGKKALGGAKSATSTEKNLPLIVIGLDKEQVKNLKNRSEIEKLKKQITGTLIHELVHRKQNLQMSQKFIDHMYANLDDFQYAYKTGYSIDDKGEIEAYARQAAFDLEQKDRESEIIDAYRYYGGSTWKRFLKKLYQYLDMYGTDIGKEELTQKLKSLK